MWRAGTSCRDEVAGVGPGIDVPFPAGFHDGDGCSVEAATSSVLVPNPMSLARTTWRSARSASLLVAGSRGSMTKAMMASQSLRISRARARTFSSMSC